MNVDRNSSLTALWQMALTRPLHSMSCGCSVPSAGFLKAGDLELDLLDYVEDKHQLQNIVAWNEARTARETSMVGAYPEWMWSLRGAVLSEQLFEMVVSDLQATLESITAHAMGRFAPAGSLQTGWLGDGLRLQN